MNSSRSSARTRGARPSRKERPPRRRTRSPREWDLIDLLPSPLPVTQAEIEILDRMLGTRIDAILKE